MYLRTDIDIELHSDSVQSTFATCIVYKLHREVGSCEFLSSKHNSIAFTVTLITLALIFSIISPFRYFAISCFKHAKLKAN